LANRAPPSSPPELTAVDQPTKPHRAPPPVRWLYGQCPAKRQPRTKLPGPHPWRGCRPDCR